MGKVFFISDAHIGAEKREREEAKMRKLTRFFKIVKDRGDALFVLGDFFDFWFNYREVIFSRYFDVLCELKSLGECGVEIHIFGGNHDWWLARDEFLKEKLKAVLYEKPVVMEILGKRFFIAHGDGLAPSDWGYRNLLKPILRNPLSMWLFGRIPAEFALAVAKVVSSSSKLYIEKRDLRLEREYEDFARKTIIQSGVDFVVLGHLHLPMVKSLAGGVYVNIGDFFRNFTYAEFDGEDLKIASIGEE